MKQIKSIGFIFIFLINTMILLTGCAASDPQLIDNTDNLNSLASTHKLSIVTTLFPQYDFARQIAGDKADVTLLLTAGMESHSFEPTAADIISINKADIFIYTGNEMEAWVAQVLDSIDSSVKIVDLSQGINLIEEEHDETDSAQNESDHEHSVDPHIWTNPVNAKKMVSTITDALCETDSDNSTFYQANLAAYQNELDKLDATFRDIVANSSLHTIVFGGRFAFHYFTEEYGLDYIAAYDSCSSETEPSVKIIAQIIDYIEKNNVPVIYYEELTDPQVARSISETTGCDMLLLHSCHNVSKTDFENGVTYLSLMNQNAENLKKGLKYNGQ